MAHKFQNDVPVPPLPMVFHAVESGAPHEGNLVLVRLKDNTYRFGMVLMGRFANYEPHSAEFVTMAHPERITHWLRVIPPVPFAAEVEASPPTIEQAAMAAGGIDRAEDVYA